MLNFFNSECMNNLQSSLESLLSRMVEEATVRALENFSKNFIPKEVPSVVKEENFTITQLAEYWQCHVQTVMKKKKAGLIPFYQSGRKVFFKKSEIDKNMFVPTIRGKRK